MTRQQRRARERELCRRLGGSEGVELARAMLAEWVEANDWLQEIGAPAEDAISGAWRS